MAMGRPPGGGGGGPGAGGPPPPPPPGDAPPAAGAQPPPPDGGGKRGPRETTLTLTLKDGQLTGSQSGRGGDTPIANASFKGDMISFTVEREMQGNKFVVKYEGKLDGDTIKGTIELPGRDGGEPRKVDWNATRAK